MTKKYFWFKMKENFFQSKAIKKLRKIAGGDTYTIIYLKLILNSLKNGGKLYYECFEDDIMTELALDIDEKEDDVKITFAYLLQHKLIVNNDEYEYIVNDILESIGSETSIAQRVRKHREKKKLLGNTNVTPLKQNVNGELEIDIEKDIDIDKKTKSKAKPKKALAYNDYPDIKDYRYNVKLREQDYNTLIRKFEKPRTEKMIDCLSNYKLAHDKTYKSDYGAILSWVVDKLGYKPIQKEITKDLKTQYEENEKARLKNENKS